MYLLPSYFFYFSEQLIQLVFEETSLQLSNTLLSRQNRRQSSLYIMALYFECRINKNALLKECYFGDFAHWVRKKCPHTRKKHFDFNIFFFFSLILFLTLFRVQSTNVSRHQKTLLNLNFIVWKAVNRVTSHSFSDSSSANLKVAKRHFLCVFFFPL